MVPGLSSILSLIGALKVNKRGGKGFCTGKEANTPPGQNALTQPAV